MTPDQIRAEFEKHLEIDDISKKWQRDYGEYDSYSDDDKWTGFLAGYNARQADNKEALEALAEIEEVALESRHFTKELRDKFVTIKKALGVNNE